MFFLSFFYFDDYDDDVLVLYGIRFKVVGVKVDFLFLWYEKDIMNYIYFGFEYLM